MTEITSKTMEKNTIVRGAACSSSDDWSDMKSRTDCLRQLQIKDVGIASCSNGHL